MSSYTWSSFPTHGTSNFEIVARDALEGWRTNGAAMEVRLNELESGTFFSGLGSPIIPSSAIISIDPTLIGDGSLPMEKLDVDGTLSDGVAYIYRDATGWGMEPIEGVVGGDTYQVKYSSADTPGFLEAKVASDAQALAGTINVLMTAAQHKLGQLTASVNNWGTVSGAVGITPTHGVQVLEASGDVTLTLSGFDNSAVHYSVMLILANPSGFTVTWGNQINWPDGMVPDFGAGRHRLLLSTYDGGANFDASAVISYDA